MFRTKSARKLAQARERESARDGECESRDGGYLWACVVHLLNVNSIQFCVRLFIRRPKAKDDSFHFPAPIYVNLSLSLSVSIALSHNRILWIVQNTTLLHIIHHHVAQHHQPRSMKLEIKKTLQLRSFPTAKSALCDSGGLSDMNRFSTAEETPGLETNGFTNALASFYVPLDTSPFFFAGNVDLCPQSMQVRKQIS